MFDAARPSPQARSSSPSTATRSTTCADKIRTLLGSAGSRRHDPRRHGPRRTRARRQEIFTQDKDVQILVATDAAGEGINLQRAHLMVNYDLPWNPNRIEQRFGRIHRIGQTEVCHLWNLVAPETREGDVYQHAAAQARTSSARPWAAACSTCWAAALPRSLLRDLLIEAIRYGDRPEVAARLIADRGRGARPRAPAKLIEERALTHEALSVATCPANPRGHGARRGTPIAAALYRLVLPRGLYAAWAARCTSASRSDTRSPTFLLSSAPATA